MLRFKWEETGGPPVSSPVRQGFGTQLLKSVFSDTRLEYRAGGIKYEIDVHLANAPKSLEHKSLEQSSVETSQRDVAITNPV